LAAYPPITDKGIQPQQGWLWLGFREWLHLAQERFVADQSLAEQILGAFRAADPVGRRRLALLNAVMIDWLERSQRQGWLMITERESLFDALQRRHEA
jgi:hypothetical protein